MVVRITVNEKNIPAGKLADAELHFTEGALQGLKLLGFSIWDRKNGTGRSVSFPARNYTSNGGERRSFLLLRPLGELAAQERLRDAILQAYAEFEARASVAQ
jgi:hypothetical protein